MEGIVRLKVRMIIDFSHSPFLSLTHTPSNFYQKFCQLFNYNLVDQIIEESVHNH